MDASTVHQGTQASVGRRAACVKCISNTGIYEGAEATRFSPCQQQFTVSNEPAQCVKSEVPGLESVGCTPSP